MIGLMFALLSGPALVEPQAVQATLQSCALEHGRYVCRYAVPDIVIVPVPGTDIVADAPATVLESGSGPEAASPETLPLTPTVEEPAAPPVSPSVTSPLVAADPGPIRPIDTGVLTEREARLVSRCADAGWVSLCLPDDRRAARTLRDKQDAYLAVRREVARLLGDDDCDAAVKAALDGGYLGLAREARDYCSAPATGSAETNGTEAVKVEAGADEAED
ncbi:hypothetical protein [Brevundimonas sp.]|uniref:hypothetical protein n=1 Tax=Brevundimonas sp. TaxID=1871086 RepID=UPI00260BFB7D|nr:hypothetical protein [Brevundimonas sp.]